MEDGYEFQAGRRLVTIFSAPNYCGEFDNAGAMMCVDKDLRCSFKVLRPATHQPRIMKREMQANGGMPMGIGTPPARPKSGADRSHSGGTGTGGGEGNGEDAIQQ